MQMGMTLKKSLELKIVASESLKLKKAKAKLKQQMDTFDRKAGPDDLKRTKEEIAGWIERHSHERVVIKKDLSLFDQNRNSAKISKAIEKMAKDLAEERK